VDVLLRLLGLGIVTGVSWFGLAGDWADPSLLEAALPVVLVAVGFALAFREDPYLGTAGYLTFGVVTLVIVTVWALVRGAPVTWQGWLRVVSTAGAGYLSLAVPTSVLSRFLNLIRLGRESSVGLDRIPIDHPVQSRIRVLGGAFGIPIGVASAVLVGTIVGGPGGAVAGVAAGIVIGALAWNAGYSGGWGVPEDPRGLYRAAMSAPADVAGIAFGLISVMIAAGATEANQFVLDQSVELLFSPIVAVVLVDLGLVVSFMMAGRRGKLVMGLMALLGGAIGIAFGALSTELLAGGGAGNAALSRAWPLLGLAAVGAFLAVFVQRLGALVGAVGAATLAVLRGTSFGSVALWGTLGGVGGALLATIANLFLAVASESKEFMERVLGLGLIGAIVVGVRAGLGVLP